MGMANRVDRTSPRRRRAPVIPLGVLVGALAVACLLSLVTLGALWWGRLSRPAGAPSTAVLEIVPALPHTPTPDLAAQDPQLELEETPGASPNGDLTVGAYVQVAGTGGDGLRLRDQPGLNSNILLVASEAEVFQVDQGPVELDGYIWWHLVGPFDPSRQGWAVARFLQIVQNP